MPLSVGVVIMDFGVEGILDLARSAAKLDIAVSIGHIIDAKSVTSKPATNDIDVL